MELSEIRENAKREVKLPRTLRLVIIIRLLNDRACGELSPSVIILYVLQTYIKTETDYLLVFVEI